MSNHLVGIGRVATVLPLKLLQISVAERQWRKGYAQHDVHLGATARPRTKITTALHDAVDGLLELADHLFDECRGVNILPLHVPLV